MYRGFFVRVVETEAISSGYWEQPITTLRPVSYTHLDVYKRQNDLSINLSAIIDLPPIELEADSRIDDDDLIHLGELELKVIHTPGHTKGSTSLYCEKRCV